MLIAPGDVTGVVLCGGEARRMGGVEKPLLSVRGRPLVHYVLERLAPQVDTVIVSANRELPAYRAFGHPVVRDTVAGLGPLGGLASIAERVRTPWIFCCPGDSPLLATTVVQELAAAMRTEHDAAYAVANARAHYLFLLVRTERCPGIGQFLASGDRSVHGWLATVRSIPVPLDHLDHSFLNVNTPPMLHEIDAVLGRDS